MIEWDTAKITALYTQPLLDLLYQARTVHLQYFNSNALELCTLANIKTGNCPENCRYCPQSGHYTANIEKTNLLPVADILAQAKQAKAQGAQRFCMGAAWRSPPEKAFPALVEIIEGVKALGLEACMTLGMVNQPQAAQLKAAGLDFYNHNLDTSPEYYPKIITTRTYQDRLDTLTAIHEVGLNTCCGGILGLGESREDRISFLWQLWQLPTPPTSVPINRLVPVKGTPLADTPPIDHIEFIRTIACARILLPSSIIRLSAGREQTSREMQTLCLMAGANSIFYGDKLLTTSNPECHQDRQWMDQLGLVAAAPHIADTRCSSRD